MLATDKETDEYQSEMQEIIGTPPPWLIRWGMGLIFMIILMVLGISMLIRYPDMVNARLKIQSDNVPKAVTGRIQGKLEKLLVSNHQQVQKGDVLAYVEGAGNHEVILKALDHLKELRSQAVTGKSGAGAGLSLISGGELGELQNSFESFYAEYLSDQKYRSPGNRATTEDKLKTYVLKGDEIRELNGLINEFENWKSKYVLLAPQTGAVIFAGVLRENQLINTNEEVFFVIKSINAKYFAMAQIPQSQVRNVKTGQEVLIKLNSFPFQQYGLIRGKISSIAELPVRDSVFLSLIDFDLKNQQLAQPIQLKDGLTGDAEIVTRNVSLFSRMMKSMIKLTQ